MELVDINLSGAGGELSVLVSWLGEITDTLSCGFISCFSLLLLRLLYRSSNINKKQIIETPVTLRTITTPTLNGFFVAGIVVPTGGVVPFCGRLVVGLPVVSAVVLVAKVGVVIVDRFQGGREGNDGRFKLKPFGGSLVKIK